MGLSKRKRKHPRSPSSKSTGSAHKRRQLSNLASEPVDVWEPRFNSAIAGIITYMDPFEGISLLPHTLDKDFLQPFQLPEKSLLKNWLLSLQVLKCRKNPLN